MTEDPKTLIAVKLKAGRGTRNAFAIFMILLGLSAVIGVFYLLERWL